jgi:type IV pilus assembly protein PilN
MVKINLLPWREIQRKEKQQRFLILLSLSLIIVLSIFVLIHIYIANQQSFQIQRNTMLQYEMTMQDKNISAMNILDAKTKQIISKINDINMLQKTRLDTIGLLNKLAPAMPSTVFLTKLTRVDHEIIIEGKAQSSGALSEFMQQIQVPIIEKMKTSDDASIENIKTNDNFQLFTLHFQQRNKN